jgi:hypothetical protein
LLFIAFIVVFALDETFTEMYCMQAGSIAMFYPHDLDHNYRELLVWKGLLRSETANDDEVGKAELRILDHIASFSISVDSRPVFLTDVGPGKFKTAMLLLYLASKDGGNTFVMDEDRRVLVSHYYSAEVINDALSDPQTTHTSVRALLSRGSVLVEYAPHPA